MKFITKMRIKIVSCFILFQVFLLSTFWIIGNFFGEYEYRKYKNIFQSHYQEIPGYLQLNELESGSSNINLILQQKANAYHSKNRHVGFLETENGYMISFTDAGFFSRKRFTFVNQVDLNDQSVQTIIYLPDEVTFLPAKSFTLHGH